MKILDFIDREHKEKKILIHCDQGLSRSPTVGLLYLAKRLKIIEDESYGLARDDFLKIYPYYNPSGVTDYVSLRWKDIV